MSDVVQNVRIRIMGDDLTDRAFKSVNARLKELANNAVAAANEKAFGGVFSKIGEGIRGITQTFARRMSGLADGAVGPMTRAATIIARVGAAASVAAAAIGVAVAAVTAIGVAAGIATAAVIKLYGTIGQTIDKTAKLADRLGATVEGLTALQYNAELSGVGVDQLAGGMEKMLAIIGKAAGGSTEAAAALQQLGLNAQRLAGLTSDEAFSAIASKIAELPTAAERAAVSMEIFGKSGQSLLPLLSQGAAGIAAMRKQAEEVGAVFSRLDAARVEAVNDAISNVSIRLTAYLRELAVGIAPVVQAIAEKLLDILPSVNTVRTFIAFAMEAVRQAVVATVIGFEWFRAVWKSLTLAVAVGSNLILGPIDLIGIGVTKLNNLVTGSNLQWKRLSMDIGDAAKSAADAWQDALSGKISKSVNSFFSSAGDRSTESAKAIDEKARKTREAQRRAALMAEQAEGVQQMGGTLSKLRDEANAVGMSELAKKLKEVDDSAGTAAQKGLARFYVQLKASREQALELGKYFTELRTSIAQIGEGSVEKAGRLAIEKGGTAADAALARIQERARQSIEDVFKDIKSSDDPWTAWEKGLTVLDRLKAAGTITAQTFDDLRRRLGDTVEEASKTKLDDIAKKVHEAAQSPMDKAREEISQAIAAQKRGAKISDKDLEALARKALEDVTKEQKPFKIELSSGADQGMKTGVAESFKDRMGVLTPVKSIDANVKAMLKELRAANAKNGSKTPATALPA